jgi:hypothetical protein
MPDEAPVTRAILLLWFFMFMTLLRQVVGIGKVVGSKG